MLRNGLCPVVGVPFLLLTIGQGKMRHIAHLELAKKNWAQLIEPGDIAIDATCGNGWDSLFLVQLPISKLFAFDIQPAAIEFTRVRLKEYSSRVFLRCESHAQFPNDLNPRLIIYNLGYLPGGNKTLTTRTGTTIESVKSALSILRMDGAISIMCYPGHEEGALEEKALLQFTSSLPKTKWNVTHYRWEHRPKLPSLFWIERLYDSKTAPSFR